MGGLKAQAAEAIRLGVIRISLSWFECAIKRREVHSRVGRNSSSRRSRGEVARERSERDGGVVLSRKVLIARSNESERSCLLSSPTAFARPLRLAALGTSPESLRSTGEEWRRSRE